MKKSLQKGICVYTNIYIYVEINDIVYICAFLYNIQIVPAEGMIFLQYEMMDAFM